MGRSAITSVASSLLLLLGAVPALGQGTKPPDDSAVDMYIEGLPGASGERPARDARPARESQDGPQGPLDAAAVAKLEASGADGAAAAAVAQRAAPTREELRSAARRGGPGADAARDADRDRGSPLGAIGALAGSEEGGMGAALPIILGMALLVAIGVALIRRRNPGDRAG